MSIEAMKQALKKAIRAHDEIIDDLKNAALDSLVGVINDLEQAIAEAEKQEPVAWMRNDGTLKFADGKMFAVGQPFYTHPQPKREWVGLADVQIEAASYHHTESEGFKQGAYWAMEKLKEKNT